MQRVPHRAGVWWRRLLAVGFGLVLAGGMAEVIARAYYAWTRHDAAYLVTPLLKTKATGPVQYAFPAEDFYNDEHPGAPHQQGERGIRWYFKIRPGDYPPPEPYAYSSLHINSLGFRGPEFDPENRDGRRRNGPDRDWGVGQELAGRKPGDADMTVGVERCDQLPVLVGEHGERTAPGELVHPLGFDRGAQRERCHLVDDEKKNAEDARDDREPPGGDDPTRRLICEQAARRRPSHFTSAS